MRVLQRLALRPRPGIFAIPVALLLFSVSLAAAAATLSATEDAFTKGNLPSSNYGGWSKVVTKDWSNFTSFVKFDIGSLSTNIESAKLRIPIKDVDKDGRIVIHPVSGNWSERSITHSTAPSYGGGQASFDVTMSMRGQTITVDVTRLVNDLAGSGWNSIAFTTSNASVDMGSKDGGSPIRLEVITGSGGGGSSGGGSDGGGTTGGSESSDSLAAVADAYTRGDRKTSNFGKRSDVRTQLWNDVTAFARFDLGRLSSGISVNSAKLTVKVDDVRSGGTVTVHRVLDAWGETSITHANKPRLSSPIASFSVSMTDIGKSKSFDATQLARELVGNRSRDYGIAFVTSNAKLHVDSREAGSPMRLEINGGSSGSGGDDPDGGGGSSSNQPPTISGQPPTSISAGASYDFRPQVSDPDGDTTSCSIKNKPAWASFSSSTCRLYGTPDDRDIGIHGEISITASDGTASATLGPFEVEVAEGGNSSVTLSWEIPTKNTDGSTLRDLDAFRIDWSRRNSTAKGSIRVDNPSVSTYVVENLAPGTYNFTVVAINEKGVASSASNMATATVD